MNNKSVQTLLKYSVASLCGFALISAMPALGVDGVWTNAAGGSWTNTVNWDAGVIADGTDAKADFSTLSLSADGSVTLDGNRTIGNLLFGDMSGLYNWDLSDSNGSILTMAVSSGAPTLTVNNQSVTIGVPLAGSGGLYKLGNGTVVFTATNTYAGSVVVTNGTVTYSGTAGNTGAGYVYLGSNAGRSVMNMNSSGTVTLGQGGNKIYVGGTANAGGGSDTSAGVINQTSGILNLIAGNNVKIAAGSATCYGGINLQGGSMSMQGTVNAGYGGVCVIDQSGGTFSVTRYLGMPGYAGSLGVATFTGGTASLGQSGSSGADISLAENGDGALNVGTLAGGNAVVTANASATKGTRIASTAGVTGNLNLNSGTFVVNNWIYRVNSGANAYVNFDGGILQAGSACTMLNNNLSAVNLYRDGAFMDSQDFVATSLANLQSASGDGIYPSGGGWAYADGAGYIGAPAVTVSGGSGSGAQAVATISDGQLTGVVMTCPGQNYQVGDELTFAFSGGGATTSAASFMHTLTAGEVSANNMGGLTKLGSGTLILSGTNTYNGATTISAGTLLITPANGGASGNYTVVAGTTLDVKQNSTGDFLAMNALALNSGSSLTLDETNIGVPLIVVSNTLTTAATVTLNLASLTPAVGQYSLIKYGSLGGGGFSAITLGSVPSAPGLSLSLSNNAANQSIDLVVVATVSNLKWNGNVNGSWDIGGTANWQGGVYYTEAAGVGPIVNFDDSASGTTAITLDTTVAPTAMVVSNNTLPYSIGGSGVITGNGGLIKQGSGMLTLATANTLSGQISVLNGTLQLGDGSASNGSVAGNILDNGSLVVANPNSQTIDSSISGTGSLTKNGSGTLTLTSSNAVTGPVAINAGTLALNSEGTGGDIPVLGSVSGVNVASGAGLTFAGANSFGVINSALPPVTIADNSSLVSTSSGTNYIGGLSLGASTMSGSGTVFVNGNLTNTSTATVNLDNLSSASPTVFLGDNSTLTVNGNLNLGLGGAANAEFITGDINGYNPGTLTTRGNVTSTSAFLELDWMNWNFDLGTNSLFMSSKLTISKSAILPVYVNWLSGNGLIASVNGFAIADGAGAAEAHLEVSGGDLVISNNTFRSVIGNGGTATIDVSGGSLSFMGNDPIQLGGDINYAAAGANGTLNISDNGSVLFGPLCPGLRLAADLNHGSPVSPVTGTINLNGGTLTVWGNITNGSTGPTDIGGSSYFNFNGGKLIAGTNNATFLQGLTQASVQSGGAIIDDGGNTVTIGQALTDGGGGGGLTKLGSGTLILTDSSTYTGATTISNGTLQVNGSLAVSPVTVADGGTLSGNGVLGAAVVVNDGGVLSPGTNVISTDELGTLTVNSDLTLTGSLMIGVNKSLAQPNSMVAVSGTLTNAGTGMVIVTNLGPDLAVGDSFQLFNQPLLNGNTMSIPSIGGVTWTNMLAIDGTIKVVSVAPPINPQPGVVQYSLSGSQLTLSWPTNLGWILQAQTNALTAGLNTNWVNISGSDAVTNMIFDVDPTKGAVFYRMVHP